MLTAVTLLAELKRHHGEFLVKHTVPVCNRVLGTLSLPGVGETERGRSGTTPPETHTGGGVGHLPMLAGALKEAVVCVLRDFHQNFHRFGSLDMLAEIDVNFQLEVVVLLCGGLEWGGGTAHGGVVVISKGSFLATEDDICDHCLTVPGITTWVVNSFLCSTCVTKMAVAATSSSRGHLVQRMCLGFVTIWGRHSNTRVPQ